MELPNKIEIELGRRSKYGLNKWEMKLFIKHKLTRMLMEAQREGKIGVPSKPFVWPANPILHSEPMDHKTKSSS